MAKIVCKKRTLQEAFNHVWKFLNLQGGPSYLKPSYLEDADNSSGNKDAMFCAYLGPGGKRCGAGSLLPTRLTPEQKAALKAAEGNDAQMLANSRIVSWGTPTWFTDKLQDCHDSTNAGSSLRQWRSRWRVNMRLLAEQNNLDVPPIPKGAKR